MRLFAVIILAGTVAMLAVHVSTWKLVEAWYGPGDSRLGKILSPRRVLRGEAIYWAMVLLAWPLWQSLTMKVMVATFAAIHIAAWLAGEIKRAGITAGPAGGPRRRKLAAAITAFDLIETLALIAVGWFAAANAVQ